MRARKLGFYAALLLGFVIVLGSAREVFSQAATRPVTERDVKEGRAIYLRECSACHGERGDGDSPAAKFLDTKPRNFLTEKFKFRSTDSGLPPTTSDLLLTVERGIQGTAMPSFSFLTEDERRKVVAFVLSLADLVDQPEPQALTDPGEPPPTTPETVARGKEIFTTMKCAQCHGERGKGDGPSAPTLKDDQERPIKVRDFTTGLFRGGKERKALFHRIMYGIDGTPMPAHGSLIEGKDRWAIIDYVLSLVAEPKTLPLSPNPILAGRKVAGKFFCRGCHVLDDGKGGNAGPDLRVAGQKLGSDWVKTFLKDPRAYGRIYPWRVPRMPKLDLSDEEIDVMAKYLFAMGKRADPAAKIPDVTRFPETALAEGKNIYILRCTECHNLGTVIQIPEAKSQGPDLSKVAGRVDFDWARKWIADPIKVDPKTKMTVPGITPQQIDAVRMFIWKASLEQKSAP